MLENVLGPLYYYAMVPFMMTYPEPTGPAYAMAVFGILTVALLYIWEENLLVNEEPIASALYATAPIVIQLSDLVGSLIRTSYCTHYDVVFLQSDS